jgi:cobalamin 5'-phosphate synthase/cobalamin synthase
VKSVLAAAAFLTRLPVPAAAGAPDVAYAVRWFPVVGATLGGAAGVLAWLMRDVLGLSSALTATALVGFGAWVTGAIHLDGLADTADGFGGGRTRDDVLRIMRDPAIGSYGAVALVMVIATKATALATLLDRHTALPWIVTAPALSRWTISLLGWGLPYARREGGLGEAATHTTPSALFVSTTFTAIITVVFLRSQAPLALTAALLGTVWIGRASRRRIGGVTGDVFGAGVESSETAVLLIGALLSGFA